jgi:hypothetical protein
MDVCMLPALQGINGYHPGVSQNSELRLTDRPTQLQFPERNVTFCPNFNLFLQYE